MAGLLLTGGTSRRMGRDKATLVIGGQRLVDRTAAVLSEVCSPALEVGPGHSDLPAVTEDPPGQGPLAAMAAGGRSLVTRGHRGPAIVLAVDMPNVTAALLRFLADFPGGSSVVPFVEGRAQPLCARYSGAELELAAKLVAAGERSMQALLEAVPGMQWAGPRMWGDVAGPEAFADLDEPADLNEAMEQ